MAYLGGKVLDLRVLIKLEILGLWKRFLMFGRCLRDGLVVFVWRTGWSMSKTLCYFVVGVHRQGQ